ncbi:MAG: hypothetical protein ABJE95_08330 [Byssovorax sp.]
MSTAWQLVDAYGEVCFLRGTSAALPEGAQPIEPHLAALEVPGWFPLDDPHRERVGLLCDLCGAASGMVSLDPTRELDLLRERVAELLQTRCILAFRGAPPGAPLAKRPPPPAPPPPQPPVPIVPAIIHATVGVVQIDFTANQVIEKDTLGDFPSPEWMSLRADADQSPICYVRGASVPLAVVLRVLRAPTGTESVVLRGHATVGAATLEWTCTVSVSPGSVNVSTPSMTSSAPLPNVVACYDPLTITWEANAAGTGWIGAGTTTHLVYTVLGAPVGTLYWTLVDLSCRAAQGASTEASVVTRSFVPFTTRALTRKRDGVGLTYWSPNTTTCTNTRLLLASPDGSGQCGSWAELLVDMYKLHGITSADKVVVVVTVAAWTSSTQGFLVKNWQWNAATQPAPWTHRMGTDVVNQPGIPGQRNPEPPPAFFNHFVVTHGGQLYDPSYGGGPFADQATWETGALDGLFAGPLAGFQKSANPQNIVQMWNTRTNARI